MEQTKLFKSGPQDDFKLETSSKPRQIVTQPDDPDHFWATDDIRDRQYDLPSPQDYTEVTQKAQKLAKIYVQSGLPLPQNSEAKAPDTTNKTLNVYAQKMAKPTDPYFYSLDLIETKYPKDISLTYGNVQWALNQLKTYNLLPPRKWRNWREDWMYNVFPVVFQFLAEMKISMQVLQQSLPLPAETEDKEPQEIVAPPQETSAQLPLPVVEQPLPQLPLPVVVETPVQLPSPVVAQKTSLESHDFGDEQEVWIKPYASGSWMPEKRKVVKASLRELKKKQEIAQRPQGFQQAIPLDRHFLKCKRNQRTTHEDKMQLPQGRGFTWYTPRPSADVTKYHLKGVSVETKLGPMELSLKDDPPTVDEVDQAKLPSQKDQKKPKQRTISKFSSQVRNLEHWPSMPPPKPERRQVAEGECWKRELHRIDPTDSSLDFEFVDLYNEDDFFNDDAVGSIGEIPSPNDEEAEEEYRNIIQSILEDIEMEMDLDMGEYTFSDSEDECSYIEDPSPPQWMEIDDGPDDIWQYVVSVHDLNQTWEQPEYTIDYEPDWTLSSDDDEEQYAEAGVDQMDNVVKEENVQFTDERETVIDKGYITTQIQTTAQNVSMQEREWHIRSILERPINIDTFEWSTSDDTGKELKFYTVPGDTLIGQHANMVSSFIFWRGHPKIRVQINSTKFHFGRLLVVWIPMFSTRQYTDYLWRIDQLLSFPHVMLDASYSNSGVLDIPFVHMDTYFNSLTKRPWNYLGQLKILVFNRLGVTTSASPRVDVSVWVSYQNCELHQPLWNHDITFPKQNAEAGVEGLAKSLLPMAGAALGIPPALTTTVGNVIGMASNCDKPTNPQEIVRWVPNVVSSLNFGDGLDQCNRLSLQTGTYTLGDADMISTTRDDANLKLIMQIPTRLQIHKWSTQTGPRTLLWATPVYPTCYVDATDDSTVQPAVTVYSPTLLSYITRTFKYWRGSLKYKIQVIASQMQTGRLQFAFVPGTYETDFQKCNYTNVEIMDIQEKNEIEITIPYMSERPWLRSDKYYAHDNKAFIPECYTGHLVCHVLNRLTSPDSSTQTIEINLLVSAGDDFEVVFPTDISFVKGSGNIIPKPQYTESGPETVTTRTEDISTTGITSGGSTISSPATSTMGENAMNLKTLLRRYTKVIETTSTVGHRTCMFFPNTPHMSSVSANFGTTYHIQFRTTLSHFAELFTFWRGSLRYKIIINTPSPHTTIRVLHIPGVFRFEMTGKDEVEDIDKLFGNLEANGVMIGHSRIQGSLEFEIPFYTPYTQLQTFEGNTQTARSATGSVAIIFHTPFESTPLSLDLYQAAGDDFSYQYLRGAPRIQVQEEFEEGRTIEDDAVNLYTNLPWPNASPAQAPEGIFDTMRDIYNLPTKVTDTLTTIDTAAQTATQTMKAAVPITEATGTIIEGAKALQESIGSLGSMSPGIVGWTITTANLVSGFNSYIQADSLIVKAFGIVTIVSELLGSLIHELKTRLFDVAMKVIEFINGSKQGNQLPEASFLDFAAPLMATLGAGALLLGFKHIPSDKETMDIVSTINNKLRLFNSTSLAATNIQRIWTQINEITETIMEKILGLVAPQVLASLKLNEGFERVQAWVADVDEIFSTNYVARSNFDTVFRNKCIRTVQEGKHFQSLLLAGKVGREGSVIKDYIKRCYDLEKEVKEAHTRLPFRTDPFSICVYGEPGVGKSGMVLPLLASVMDDLNYPREDRLCTVNWTEEYFTENYDHQPAVYGDDISTFNDDAQYKNFFNLKSNTQFPLNMAFKKGKCFTSDFIVTTTNTGWPAPNCCTDIRALLRRRDVLIEMRWRRGIDHVHQLDNSHAEFRFRNQYSETGYSSPWMDYDALVVETKRRARIYFNNQHNMVRHRLNALGYPLPPNLENFIPYDLPEQNPEIGLEEFQKYFPPIFTSKKIIKSSQTVDMKIVETHPTLSLFTDDDWLELLVWDDEKQAFFPATKTESTLRRFELAQEWYEEQGLSLQAALLDCVRTRTDKPIMEKLRSFKDWIIAKIAEAIKEFPWLDVLKKWPVKLALALVALGGIAGLTARVVHKCICASLRYMGFRCAKCGKWPKLEKCKDKEWMMKEWKEVYGPTEEYEENRQLSLQEEQVLREALGAERVEAPHAGTEKKFQTEGVYAQDVKGLTRHQVFAENSPYHTNTLGAKKVQVFAESGNQRLEDLITNRFVPYIYRIHTKLDEHRAYSVNAVAIGERLLILPKHFIPNITNGKFSIYHGNQWMEVKYEESRATAIPNKDLLVYDMPPQFHQHRSMVKHFISEKDLGALDVTSGTLIRRLNESTVELYRHERIESVKRVKYSDHLGHNYVSVGAWKYPMAASPGACGSLLITHNKNVSGVILGFHITGDGSSARSQLITREMLEKFLADRPVLGTPVPEVVVPTISQKLEGHFSPVGRVKPQEGVFQNKQTCIIPTEIHGLCYPPVTEPSVLVANDPRLTTPTNVMKKAIEKYGQTPLQFDPKDLERVFNHLESEFETWHPVRIPSVLTKEEAVLGCPEYEGFERLPMDTSPGFPYTLSRPSGERGKAYLFDSETGKVVNKELETALDMRLALAKRRERVKSVWTCCLKDERRPMEKIKAGSTRLFVIPPVDLSLVTRMYTLDFSVTIQEHRHVSFTKVGIDPQSLEWTELYDWLAGHSDICFAGDFTRFDGTIPPDLTMKFYEHCDAFYRRHDPTYTEEHRNVRMTLADESIHTVHICGRDIFINHTGNESGDPNTTKKNSIVNYYYMALAWLGLSAEHCPAMCTMDAFSRNTRLAVFGDDNIVSISHEVKEWYNQVTVAKFLARHGIVYTNARKDGVDAFIKVDDATFLKNRFANHESISHIKVPLMAEDTIHELLNWTRIAPDQRKLLQDNCNDALRFSYFYGIDFFTTIRNKINAALRTKNIPIRLMTYDDFHYWFLFVTGHLPRPTSTEGFFEKVAQNGNDYFSRLIMRTIATVPIRLLSLMGLLETEDKSRERTDTRHAIAIPSGEGKSWLCAKYPGIFVDHDELLLPAARQILKKHGLSATALRKLFELDFPLDDRRILLCHHPDNTRRQILGVYVLPKPNYIRANEYQRLRLKNPKQLDMDSRNREIMALAREVEPDLFNCMPEVVL